MSVFHDNQGFISKHLHMVSDQRAKAFHKLILKVMRAPTPSACVLLICFWTFQSRHQQIFQGLLPLIETHPSCIFQAIANLSKISFS